MSIKNPGGEFIHSKDSKLHTSKEVEHEQKRRKSAGETTSQKPAEKLEAFLKVLEKTHGHQDPAVLERIKKSYYRKYLIKPANIPESYIKNQFRIMREHGIWTDYEEHIIESIAEQTINQQKASLDNWLNYFTSETSHSFPIWAKYWAFTSMVKLSEFDEKKHAFGKRDKGTVAPFPNLDHEALAHVIDAIVKRANKENIAEQDQRFKTLLERANFGKLYAWAIEKVVPFAPKTELLKKIEGSWVKYAQGTDHLPLVKSIQNHGTGWCTAGETTAKSQLSEGDFYVYYSLDARNKPTIPRIAIRMVGEHIAELCGIADGQELDPYIGDIAKEKLNEFPGSKEFLKKNEDMKHMTEIEKKVKSGQDLTKEDLIFLYEINSYIEGYSWMRDPRIEEILNLRDPQRDMLMIFSCRPDQIAHSPDEVNKDTVVYEGELSPGIFNELKHVKHIYTIFPEGKIIRKEIAIGGKSAKELEKELEQKGVEVSDITRQCLETEDFKPSEQIKNLDLVILELCDLMENSDCTIKQIYENAEESGLEKVPLEVGPYLCLQHDEDLPPNKYLIVGSDLSSSGSLATFSITVGYNLNNRKKALLVELIKSDEAVWERSHDFLIFARPSVPEALTDKGK